MGVWQNHPLKDEDVGAFWGPLVVLYPLVFLSEVLVLVEADFENAACRDMEEVELVTFFVRQDFFCRGILVVIDYHSDVLENNIALATDCHRIGVGALVLYLHPSSPLPFQRPQEDHLCNHLCRFHKRSSDAYAVEGFHDLEEGLSYDRGEPRVFHDEEEGGCMLEVCAVVQ